MLASRQHVSLNVPAAFPIGDALPGRGGGGLLAVTHTGDGTWFLAYDGNGNVTGYVDESGGSAAAYRYDPYGLLVSATGPEKDRFRHRFSTKPQDRETGLLYYGYRYLETTTGRWPSRDPIGEEGGLNLYGFVGNDGVNGWDLLGQSGFLPPSGGSRAYFPPSPRPPLHPDNRGLNDWFDDPEASCFNEGWLRHCILSCRLQHKTGAGWLTQLGAQISGNDLPWQSTRDQGDMDANQQGINNAVNNGPGDSCVDRCTEQWWAKLRNECCVLDAKLTKDSSRCCELNYKFNNYHPGRV